MSAQTARTASRIGLVLVAQPVEVEAGVHADDRRVREVVGRRFATARYPRPGPNAHSEDARERADLGDRHRLPGRVVHAVGMAELGYSVVGVDVDPVKIAALQDGQAPFYEPDLDPLLRKHVDGGDLRFSTEIAEAPMPMCISSASARRSGTTAGCRPEISRRGDRRAGRSPAGGPAWSSASRRFRSELPTVRRAAGRGAPAGAGVELAWNPEFLREGHAVEDTLRPDRLVFGVRSERGGAGPARDLRPGDRRGRPVVVTDLPTAELVKASPTRSSRPRSRSSTRWPRS